MSDLHPLPLMGHDMPEAIPPLRAKACVYPLAEGWHWEHECAPGWWKTSDIPWTRQCYAYDAAVKHLKECRR